MNRSIAIVDTGIDLDHLLFGPDNDNNDIADKIVYSNDFTAGQIGDDKNGHGSNVAGIASGLGNGSSIKPGTDSNGNLINLKVFTDAGTGNILSVRRALDWVLKNYNIYNIKVVNLSFGSGGYFTSYTNSSFGNFGELERRGITTVAAAGNYFQYNKTRGVITPASDPYTLSVGAWDSSKNTIASFSQRDPITMDILAPGVKIHNAFKNGKTATYSGTSMAAPYISGLVSQANDIAKNRLGRSLKVNEHRYLLQQTGNSFFDSETQYTYKVVNDQAYLQAVSNLNSPIRDNIYTVAVQQSSYKRVNESSSTVYITIARNGNIDQSSSTSFSFSGSATFGVDYTIPFTTSGIPNANSGVITFSPGEVTKVLPIRIIDDNVNEPTEFLNFNIDSSKSFNSSETITILDNDTNGSNPISEDQELKLQVINDNIPVTLEVEKYTNFRSNNIEVNNRHLKLIDSTAVAVQIDNNIDSNTILSFQYRNTGLDSSKATLIGIGIDNNLSRGGNRNQEVFYKLEGKNNNNRFIDLRDKDYSRWQTVNINVSETFRGSEAKYLYFLNSSIYNKSIAEFRNITFNSVKSGTTKQSIDINDNLELEKDSLFRIGTSTVGVTSDELLTINIDRTDSSVEQHIKLTFRGKADFGEDYNVNGLSDPITTVNFLPGESTKSFDILTSSFNDPSSLKVTLSKPSDGIVEQKNTFFDFIPTDTSI